MSDDKQQVERDPAASMLLLRTIIEDALDPGYKQMAEGGKKRLSVPGAAVVFLMVGLLTFGTTWAVKDLRADRDEAGSTAKEMREHVDRLEDVAVQLEKENHEAQAQVRAMQLMGSRVGGPEFDLQVAASSDRVVGPGVVVQMTDGTASASREASQVKDSDLRFVMNVLWGAGAEAMALNGKRIGYTTTVRTAGSAILVNVAPATPPYIIEAIGDPTNLMDALEMGDTGREVALLVEARGIGLSATRAEMVALPGLSLESGKLRHPNEEED